MINFIDTSFQIQFQQEQFIPSQKINTYDNLQKNPYLFNSSSLKDINSINKLQNNLIECLKYHELFLSNLNLPEQIDIKFLHTNKLEKIYNNLIGFEYAGNTFTNLNPLNNLKNPLINISTDIVKYFNQNNLELLDKYPLGKNNFLNSCRKLFSNSNYDATKIITELVFLHELGHVYLNHNYSDTILISGLTYKNNEKIPPLNQISENLH